MRTQGDQPRSMILTKQPAPHLALTVGRDSRPAPPPNQLSALKRVDLCSSTTSPHTRPAPHGSTSPLPFVLGFLKPFRQAATHFLTSRVGAQRPEVAMVGETGFQKLEVAFGVCCSQIVLRFVD